MYKFFISCLAAPSEIFEGRETTALRSCDINPYFSSSGKVFVNLYIDSTKSMDILQTSKSL